MNIWYLFLAFICIFIIFKYSSSVNHPKIEINKYQELYKNTEQIATKKYKKIIFTITTFFDFAKEDNWILFCNAMDSILHFHPNIYSFIDFYVINEYSIEPKEDWKLKLNQKYPFITLIQKTEDLKGHAESLNLVLNMIKPYTYWIHWEEAWYVTRPFLFDAIKIMDNTKITQFQFTKESNHTHWLDKSEQKNCHFVPNNNGYCTIDYKIEDYPKIDLTKNFSHDNWMNVKLPLYSTKPSINRIKDYKFGLFLTSPEYCPLKFQIDFGERWMKNKYIKGIFSDGPVTRKSLHVP